MTLIGQNLGHEGVTYQLDLSVSVCDSGCQGQLYPSTEGPLVQKFNPEHQMIKLVFIQGISLYDFKLQTPLKFIHDVPESK